MIDIDIDTDIQNQSASNATWVKIQGQISHFLTPIKLGNGGEWWYLTL